MLTNLYVENLVLIERMEIELSAGINIFTGETGSGKSLIFDSIAFVLGDKCSKDIIRTGREKCIVKAFFKIENEGLIDKIKNYGIDIEDDGSFMIEREYSISGRSIYRLNGSPVTQSIVKDLRNQLVDIYQQNQNIDLLNEATHIDYLDSFALDQLDEIFCTYKVKYNEYQEIVSYLNRIEQQSKERERNIDILNYQLNEIKSANLVSGEEESLNSRKQVLLNIKRIMEVLSKTYSLLQGSDEYGASVLDGLRGLLSDYNSMQFNDDNLKNIGKIIEDSYYSLEECKNMASDYIDSINNNEEELENILERIDLINRLKKKYGSSIDEILEFGEKIEKELDLLVNIEEQKSDKESRKYTLNIELTDLAQKIHTIREKEAAQLEIQIKSQLNELNMKNIELKVRIEEGSLNEKGSDTVVFLISTNIGEPLKSLNKIVSGGELSRIMLAMKVILTNDKNSDTLIFDEIDTGMSGKAAWAVSEKLAILGRNKQIFCITHLPQIASMADNHFLIEKIVKDGSTYTQAESVKDHKKFIEIARLLDGSNYNQTSIEHSKQMVSMGNDFKNKIQVK